MTSLAVRKQRDKILMPSKCEQYKIHKVNEKQKQWNKQTNRELEISNQLEWKWSCLYVWYREK